MDDWLRLPPLSEAEKIVAVADGKSTQKPFWPSKRRKVQLKKRKATTTITPSHGALDRSGNKKWKLAAKSFTQLDNRVRQLEGDVHDSIATSKEDTVVVEMKQAGREYNSAAKGKKNGPAAFVCLAGHAQRSETEAQCKCSSRQSFG